MFAVTLPQQVAEDDTDAVRLVAGPRHVVQVIHGVCLHYRRATGSATRINIGCGERERGG